MSAERLALGTAQFGLEYGVANSTGRVSLDEAAAILDLARASAIDTLDTAAGYGDSEARLGEIGIAGWRIVTKVPELPDPVGDVRGWVESQLVGSLQRLGVDHVHGVLLHRPLQLDGPHGSELDAALVGIRDAGLTDRIGVSVYGPDQLDRAWDEGFDLVQAPFNVLDRRLVTSGWLERLSDAGAEVHTRSAFLQGLLLMDRRPPEFDRWVRLFARWGLWLGEHELDAVQACLGFVTAEDRIDRVVVGVDSADQLREIVANVATPTVAPPDDLVGADPDLIDPSRWNLL